MFELRRLEGIDLLVVFCLGFVLLLDILLLLVGFSGYVYLDFEVFNVSLDVHHFLKTEGLLELLLAKCDVNNFVSYDATLAVSFLFVLLALVENIL